MTHLARFVGRTVLEIGSAERVRAVEVHLDVHDCQDGVLAWWAAGPSLIAVAPVVHDDVARVIVADVLRAEDGEELTVCVECHGAGCPIEAVFVESGGQVVGEVGCSVVRCAYGIVTLGFGLGGLEDEIHGAIVCGELTREKFHVDFLAVVVVLRRMRQWMGSTWRSEPITQKHEPQVPFTDDNFMPIRKDPYCMSSLGLSTSPIGIIPLLSFALTHSWRPASPPLMPDPDHALLSFNGFGMTLESSACLPNCPRAACAVTWYCWGCQPYSVPTSLRCRKSDSMSSVNTAYEELLVELTEYPHSHKARAIRGQYEVSRAR